MKFNCAHTQLVELHKLQPNPKNPNQHPDRQIELLAKIIDYQGQRAPIVVSKRSGFITKGHGRLMAIQKLGWPKAAVDYQAYESEAQEFADLIADNKAAALAVHDDALMIETLKDLDIDDFELLGMDDFDLPIETDEARDEIEDDVPENVETRCKPGDLWVLGEHRLLCGDSTNIQHVEKLMGGEKADMVFTDPPYGAGFNIKNDQPDEFEQIFKDSMSNASTVCDSTFLICCYYSCIAEFVNHMRILGFNFNEKIVWVKNLFGQGKVFHRRHEDILFFSRDNHIKDFRNKTDDVLNIDSIRNFMGSKNAHEAVGHPTQKPTELIVKVMDPLSKQGFLIYDPFGGSGSTLIACEKTNRRCFMMELDPHYCDVIISRWENYSGKKAELKES